MLFADGPQGGISLNDKTGYFNGMSSAKISGPQYFSGVQGGGGLLVEDLLGDVTPVGAYQLQQFDDGVMTLDDKGRVTPCKFFPILAAQHFSNSYSVAYTDAKIKVYPVFQSSYPYHIERNLHYDTGTDTFVDDSLNIIFGSPQNWDSVGGTTTSPTLFQVRRSVGVFSSVAARQNPYTPSPLTLNVAYQGQAGLQIWTWIPQHPSDPFGISSMVARQDAYDPAVKTLIWESPDSPSLLTYEVNAGTVAEGSNLYIHVRSNNNPPLEGDEGQLFYDGTLHSVSVSILEANVVLRIDYD